MKRSLMDIMNLVPHNDRMHKKYGAMHQHCLLFLVLESTICSIVVCFIFLRKVFAKWNNVLIIF